MNKNYHIVSYIFVSFLVISSLQAQPLPWIEDFNNIEDTRWSIDYNGRGYLAVNDQALKAYNMDKEGTWSSEEILINDVNYVEISMDISWYGGGFFSQPDYMRVYYILNGGEETLMFEKVLNSILSSGGSATLSKVLKGENLQIIIRTFNDFGNTSYNRFDNIKVSEVTTFYSFKSGAWNNGENWSLNKFSEEQIPVGGNIFPTSREGAVIGNRNNINLIRNEEVAFLEVHQNSSLNLNTRTIFIKRGGGVYVENGGFIRHNTPNSSIEFSDPHTTNLIVNADNGIDIGRIRLNDQVKLKISGSGNIIINDNLDFLGNNAELVLDIPVSITGNVLGANNNRIINRKQINWSGNIWNTRLFSDFPDAVFDYTANGNQNIIVPQDAYNQLMLSGSGEKLLTGNIDIKNNLEIKSSAVFRMNSHRIMLSGNWSNQGTHQNSFAEGTGMVIVNGTTDQYFQSNNPDTFYQFQINKNGGEFILNQAMHVSNELIFTSGNVKSSPDHLLIFNSDATHSGSHTNSFIDGPAMKTGNQDFTFPIGEKDIYAPLGISNLSDATGFTAQYFMQPPSNGGAKTSDFSHISGGEFWDLTRTTGSNASCFVELYWTDADRSEISDPTDLIVVHFNDQITKWENMGGHLFGQSVRSTVKATHFSPFTFGSIAGINSLPVDYLSFTGSNHPHGNQLKWKTAVEYENDYFNIEKSNDTKQWIKIGQISGNGNSNIILEYLYWDNHVSPGITYYRLQQVDHNGTFAYSDVISVVKSTSKMSQVKVFPNPTIFNLPLSISLPFGGEAELQLINTHGILIWNNKVSALPGQNIIYSDLSTLPKGVYFLHIHISDHQFIEKVIVP